MSCVGYSGRGVPLTVDEVNGLSANIENQGVHQRHTVLVTRVTRHLHGNDNCEDYNNKSCNIIIIMLNQHYRTHVCTHIQCHVSTFNTYTCTMVKPYFKGKTASTKPVYSRNVIHPRVYENTP